MFHRLAIVGFGLIGGSIALAVRERWPGVHITAIDRHAVVDAALRLKAADAGSDDLDSAADADFIVLAAPVLQNVAILSRLGAHVRGGALVTDVGGTKLATVQAAENLPPRLRFVGGHPLAGAAAGGIEEARPDLFRGRFWILTPQDTTRREEVEPVRAFVDGLGAIPQIMDPRAHDTLMAYVSHLPQIAVSALMQVVGQHAGSEGLRLAGSGLRDTTRLAASPAGMWRDVAATNVEAVTAAIDELTMALQRLKNDLTSGDELQRVFDAARQWKAALEDPDPVNHPE
jgi:prephenate dehydrogenase